MSKVNGRDIRPNDLSDRDMRFLRAFLDCEDINTVQLVHKVLQNKDQAGNAIPIGRRPYAGSNLVKRYKTLGLIRNTRDGASPDDAGLSYYELTEKGRAVLDAARKG